MATPTTERRRLSRATVNIDAWVGREGPAILSLAAVDNLSEDGAFLRTIQTGEVDEQLQVQLCVAPGEDEVICSAVVRHRVGGLGVQFLDLSQEGHERLRRCISGEVE